eukprot:Opistho-2@39179
MARGVHTRCVRRSSAQMPHSATMHSLFVIACVVFAMADLSLTQKTFNFTIIETNTMTGQLFEGSYKGSLAGGIARTATAIATLKANATTGPAVLVVDTGTLLGNNRILAQMKSTSYAAIFKAYIPYDYIGISTGETFFGTSSWYDFLAITGYKAVCTNVDDRGFTYYADYLQPYYVHTLTLPDSTTAKLGIIGYIPEDYCTQAKCEFRIKPTTIIASLNDTVQRLRTFENADLVLCIGGAGIELDVPVLAAVPGIDILLGGKHYRDATPVFDVPLTRPGPNGATVHIGASYGLQQTLGNFVFQVVNGRVVASTGRDVVLYACADDNNPSQFCVPAHPNVSTMANALKTQVNARIKVIGSSLAPIPDKISCRSVQCVYGDIQADSLVAYMSGQCDFALINSGNIRTNIPVGNVTNFDTEDNIFIGTTVSVVQVKGSTIANALQISSTRIGLPGFLQLSRGIRASFDTSRPAGVRVYNISVAERVGAGALLWPTTQGNSSFPRAPLQFSPLRLDRVYYACITSFLRTGGDGYTMFRDEPVDALDNGPLMNDAIASYLTAISPFNITLDGRIKIGPAPANALPVAGACAYDVTLTTANTTYTDLCSGATRFSQATWVGVAPVSQNTSLANGSYVMVPPRMIEVTLTRTYTPAPESDLLLVYDGARTNVLSVYPSDGSTIIGRFGGPGAVPSFFLVPAASFAFSLKITLPTNRSTLAFTTRALYTCPAGYELNGATCRACAAETFKASAGDVLRCAACGAGRSTGGAVGRASCDVSLPLATHSSSSTSLSLVLPIALSLGCAVLAVVAAFYVLSRKRQKASERLQRTIIDYASLEFISLLSEGSYGVVHK